MKCEVKDQGQTLIFRAKVTISYNQKWEGKFEKVQKRKISILRRVFWGRSPVHDGPFIGKLVEFGYKDGDFKKKQLENWFEQNPKLTNLSYDHIQPVYIRAMWPMTVFQMTSDQRAQERMKNRKLWFNYLLSFPIKFKRVLSNPYWKIQPFLLLKRTVIGLGVHKIYAAVWLRSLIWHF